MSAPPLFRSRPSARKSIDAFGDRSSNGNLVDAYPLLNPGLPIETFDATFYRLTMTRMADFQLGTAAPQ
jgi:hypothetical protein